MLNKQTAKDDDQSRAYNAALRLLTAREYARRELYLKLTKKFTSTAAREAVKRCAKEGWQSDERCAQMLLRHMELKLYGPVKLQQEAVKRGLSEDLLVPLIENTDWIALALLVLKHKYQCDDLDYVTRQKALAMLYRRGFSSSMCTRALELFLGDTGAL